MINILYHLVYIYIQLCTFFNGLKCLVKELCSNEFIDFFVSLRRTRFHDYWTVDIWVRREHFVMRDRFRFVDPDIKSQGKQGRRHVRTHKFGDLCVKLLEHHHEDSFATCEATWVYLGIVPRILVRYYETAETDAHLESQRYARTREQGE